MDNIYFDNSATTVPYKDVVEEFVKVTQTCFGNPSSLHKLGIESERIIKSCEKEILCAIEADKHKIIFTSGGTESNNLAILGTIANKNKDCVHIITTKAEHPSVLKVFLGLEKKGFRVTYLSLDEKGYIDLQQLEKSICEQTLLISIHHVNNETGTIQKIEDIGKIISKKNLKTIFHVDGVQGFLKHNISFENIDLYSFSGHKIHSIKGVGGLITRKDLALSPLIIGGSQQYAMRAGTENVAAISCLNVAIKIFISRRDKQISKISGIKRTLLDEISKFENTIVNGDIDCASDYILNVSFLGINAETMLHALEACNIYVSNGSACTSKDKKDSILYSYGYDKTRVNSAIRFSFSEFNKIEEVELVISAIRKNLDILGRFCKKN